MAGCCFHSKQASERQRSYRIAADYTQRNAPMKNAHTRHSLDISSTPNVALLACGCMGGGGCGPACMWAHYYARHRKENENHAGGENYFPRWLRERKPFWYPEYFPHVGRHQARCLFSYLPEPAVRGGVQRCQCLKGYLRCYPALWEVHAQACSHVFKPTYTYTQLFLCFGGVAAYKP